MARSGRLRGSSRPRCRRRSPSPGHGSGRPAAAGRCPYPLADDVYALGGDARRHQLAPRVLGDGDDRVGAARDRRLEPRPARIQVMVVQHDGHAPACQRAAEQQRGARVADGVAPQYVDPPREAHRIGREDERGGEPVQAEAVREDRDPPAGRGRGDAVVTRQAELEVDPVRREPLQQRALVTSPPTVESGRRV